MGFFDNLTADNTEVIVDGIKRLFANPSQAAYAAARNTVAPTYSENLPNSIPEQQPPEFTQDAGDGMIGPTTVPTYNANLPNSIPEEAAPTFHEDTPGVNPQQTRPSFKDAAFDKYGNVNSETRGLTKKGVLLKVLIGGLQGAAAGAGSKTFGEGFQRAQAAPYQRITMQNNAKQEELQTQGLQQQQQMNNQVITAQDGTKVPFWLWKRGQERKMAEAELDKTLSEAEKNRREGKVTPEEQSFNAYIKKGLTPQEAYAKVHADVQKASNPPQGSDSDKFIRNYMAANQLADTPENWLKGQAEYTKLTKVNPGLIRMEGIGETRGMPVTDTKTGVTMPMSWNDYNKMSKAEPGRYVSPQYDPTTLGAVGTTKAFTTGKPAEELAAFNTAIQHADLLDEASKALNSKDTKALNSVKNKFKTEFGSSDVTNFDVIANAYAREVNKALTAGHVTDNEIKEAGATIPANASREQIVGAVQSYRNLMKSKVQIRKNQYESGMQGKPAFGQDSPKQDNGGWVMKDGIRVRKN